MMDKVVAHRILALQERIVSHFNSSDWEAVGFLTGHPDVVQNHRRLLRSLSWGDEDYAGNVLSVLGDLATLDAKNLDEIDGYLNRKYPDESHFISAKPAAKKLTFAPHVFEVQDVTLEPDLIAVMMPFSAEFSQVYEAIKTACNGAGFRSRRVDDIWETSTIIQDIFNLLLRSRIVIVDFTGRNPNVMYETGIAHTLGKLVIPISQSLSDVPFDLAHHRCLKYLGNGQGLAELTNKLTAKLQQEAPF